MSLAVAWSETLTAPAKTPCSLLVVVALDVCVCVCVGSLAAGCGDEVLSLGLGDGSWQADKLRGV